MKKIQKTVVIILTLIIILFVFGPIIYVNIFNLKNVKWENTKIEKYLYKLYKEKDWEKKKISKTIENFEDSSTGEIKNLAGNFELNGIYYTVISEYINNQYVGNKLNDVKVNNVDGVAYNIEGVSDKFAIAVSSDKENYFMCVNYEYEPESLEELYYASGLYLYEIKSVDLWVHGRFYNKPKSIELYGELEELFMENVMRKSNDFKESVDFETYSHVVCFNFYGNITNEKVNVTITARGLLVVDLLGYGIEFVFEYGEENAIEVINDLVDTCIAYEVILN